MRHSQDNVRKIPVLPWKSQVHIDKGYILSSKVDKSGNGFAWSLYKCGTMLEGGGGGGGGGGGDDCLWCLCNTKTPWNYLYLGKGISFQFWVSISILDMT